MMFSKLKISPLGHTWILDLDGTIVKHNGYKLDGYDTLLDGALAFLNNVPKGDMIVFITSRTEDYREMTETFLRNNRIWYDHIIFNAPYGERILVNDCKPSGLNTALAVNVERDQFGGIEMEVDERL